jgi:hypothetical protein
LTAAIELDHVWGMSSQSPTEQSGLDALRDPGMQQAQYELEIEVNLDYRMIQPRRQNSTRQRKLWQLQLPEKGDHEKWRSSSLANACG